MKKDPCGGGVVLRTLTKDSDSGLQLRTPIRIKKEPCGGGGVVVVFHCDNKAYPSLDLNFDFDLD